VLQQEAYAAIRTLIELGIWAELKNSVSLLQTDGSAVGDFKGWVTLRLIFDVTFRANIYGPLDKEIAIL